MLYLVFNPIGFRIDPISTQKYHGPSPAATTVLLAVEQSSEHVGFGVRQPSGKRLSGGLRPGRRGTMHERSQSRLVRLQPLFRGNVTLYYNYYFKLNLFIFFIAMCASTRVRPL